MKGKRRRRASGRSGALWYLLPPAGVYLSLAFLVVLLGISYWMNRDAAPMPPESTEPAEQQSLAPAEKRELRGVYIATVQNINFPSRAGLSEQELKSELDAILLQCIETGLNTVYFQVRPSGDALYPSKLFPSSRYLAAEEGAALPMDPLAYLTEQAEKRKIDVVAWVNPYRITASSFESREAALASLSETNPAAVHPEYTVFYGGKLYYNPALPEVRSLIAAGVEEICENYSVKGILYDDYFYPYPVSGEEFDDQASYQRYASAGVTLGDWRRQNVNEMIRLSFDTVKSVSPQMTFGVSPFGIWKNSRSDPAGSDTAGLEAYHSLYCDALAWIQGGYIDYIAPQIYWERGAVASDFTTLVAWWSRAVEGSAVELCISQAAYKVGQFALGAEEISGQIADLRENPAVTGTIQYGFAYISANTAGLREVLRECFSESFV